MKRNMRDEPERQTFLLLPFFNIFNVTVALCVCVGWATVELRNAVEMQNCPPASLMGSSVCFEKEWKTTYSSCARHQVFPQLQYHLVCSWDALHLSHDTHGITAAVFLSKDLMKHYSVLISFLSSKNKQFKQNKCT